MNYYVVYFSIQLTRLVGMTEHRFEINWTTLTRTYQWKIKNLKTIASGRTASKYQNLFFWDVGELKREHSIVSINH